MATDRLCSIEGCDKHVYARGWCNKHYCRWKAHGDPMKTARPSNGEARQFFEDQVLRHSGAECLIWPYYRMKNGYAVITIDGSPKVVSRLCCERVNGPPPSPNHHAAHSCGKGHLGCVNPEHLSWKTPKENNSDKLGHGTLLTGEDHPLSKITQDDAELMRAMHRGMTHREIATHFGLAHGTVGRIIRGEAY